MKKKIKVIITLAVALFSMSSCEKYLDEEPDMRTDINSVQKISSLLVSAYPNRNYLTFAEAASDNAEDKTAIQATHSNEPFNDLYYWKDVKGDGNGTPTEFWNASYAAIAASNHALRAIEQGNYGPEINPYKGEALIARAYNHFMLGIFFAQAYVPNGANASPGIPYSTEPSKTIFVQSTRGTVADLYAHIERDLEEGLKLIGGGEWKVPKYHFTPDAAHAFAARFYLLKNNWDKVVTHVTAISPSNSFKARLRPINSTMLAYTFAQWQQEFNKADKDYNLLLTETYSVYQRSTGFGGARYAMGEKVLAIHNGNTVFGAAFRNNNMVGVWTAPNYMLRKFYEYFHITNVASQTGQPYLMQALFTVDEALINRAEAYVELEKYDLALQDLNVFASVRITNYNPTIHSLTLQKAKDFYKLADSREALIKSILDIRRIAFMQEGLRWIDLLRHRLPIVHNHINGDGLETFETLEKDDPRRVFQLPADAISLGLEPNIR